MNWWPVLGAPLCLLGLFQPPKQWHSLIIWTVVEASFFFRPYFSLSFSTEKLKLSGNIAVRHPFSLFSGKECCAVSSAAGTPHPVKTGSRVVWSEKKPLTVHGRHVRYLTDWAVCPTAFLFQPSEVERMLRHLTTKWNWLWVNNVPKCKLFAANNFQFSASILIFIFFPSFC